MKPITPMVMLDQKCLRTMRGSISVPARKVRRIAPKPARKLTQSVICRATRLPATAPTTISTRATDIPTRIEMRDASRANPSHKAEWSQTLAIFRLRWAGRERDSPPSADDAYRSGSCTRRGHQPSGSQAIGRLEGNPIPCGRTETTGIAPEESIARYHLAAREHSSEKRTEIDQGIECQQRCNGGERQEWRHERPREDEHGCSSHGLMTRNSVALAAVRQQGKNVPTLSLPRAPARDICPPRVRGALQ